MTSLAPENKLDRILQNYGDLLYDLCETVLWSPKSAQFAMRTIFLKLKRESGKNGYTRFERPWVLRTACETLRNLYSRHARKLSPPEKVMLDANVGVDMRMKQFDSYFHQLPLDDQLLLLLRDKFGLPYHEISSAIGIPDGSLRIKRQQALQTLEEWLWDRI